MSELAYLSATEALARFRSKELSPVELLDALIERIEDVDQEINPVCDRRYVEGRAEAKVSEARYAGKGDAPRALEGVPVAAKEEHPMAGRSYSMGSLIYKDLVADETHPIIERILAAGGIIHIRTTTPEFCCAGFTHSKIWGITRNPWNHEFTPAVRAVGRARLSPLVTRRLPPVATSVAPFACRPRSVAWSVSSRRSGECPRWLRSTSTSTATTARWRVRSATARCSAT